jgi:CubicO group peptidase (beta-lactamase class C family)
MAVLDTIDAWDVPHAAGAVVAGGEVVEQRGPTDRVFRLASIAKPLGAWAILVAVEEGIIRLDSPVGQPGCTLRHLLAHAGGYSFDGADPVSSPERTRIYSNTGWDLAADAVATAAAMPFAEYLDAAVFAPLGMTSTSLEGSPAKDVWGSVADLLRFISELRAPRLLSDATVADAFCPQYPELSGIVPGVGRYAECPWGLGFELRGSKSPHWTGRHNSPRTLGHFGGAGTMFWLDPDVDVALVTLTDREFGPWALDVWPPLSDDALATYGSAT